MESFAALGYKPEQVTKILVTHKHPDHTAALQYFPDATIYIGPEDAQAMKLEGDHVVPVTYDSGSYYNFPRAQKIAEGIWSAAEMITTLMQLGIRCFIIIHLPFAPVAFAESTYSCSLRERI